MRGAVLIIGSLLWDKDPVRNDWRTNRLDLSGLESVTAPIRYGRRSQSRGNTFTMTFDANAAQGRAVAVPFRASSVQPGSVEAEAKHLWHAEQPKTAPGPIGAGWGCVGALFRQTDSVARPTWEQFFCAATRLIHPVQKNGELGISWPTRVADGLAYEADYLLATATLADSALPSPEQVADAWSAQTAGFEIYFLENVRHGIRTADDVRIWKRIKQKNPPWLRNPGYAQSRAVLDTEVSSGQ